MHAIDARARAALDAYLRAIDELHPETIETIWLYGSVVLGAYVHGRSDVDVVALVEEPLEDEALRELHARARELDPLARWVQGLYVTASDVAVPWWSGEFPLVDMAFEPPPYPRGEFLPTTRLCIHQAGVTLKGESPSELLPVVDAHDLREEMTEELDWLVFKTLEPELFLHDYWVDHAAGMVSRILVTLDTGRVVGKPEALSHLARYLPQWERVAAESLSRLDEEHRLRPESRERADTVIAMVRDVREYVRERWPLAYRRRQKTIPTVAVRPVEAGDEELVRAWWAMPALRGFAEEGERPGEVIEADGVPVGWIDPHRAYAPAWRELVGDEVGQEPWTLDLFITPEHWGRGIARLAIRQVSERCLRAGATSMVVDVERDNVASRRAFEAAGWELITTTDEAFILRFRPVGASQ